MHYGLSLLSLTTVMEISILAQVIVRNDASSDLKQQRTVQFSLHLV